MHTRVVLAAAVTGSLLVGAGAALAATSLRAGDVTPRPALTASRYWASGPSAEYDGDSGGIGEVKPLRVAVPDDAGLWDAVVEVSFTYRTRAGTPVAELDLRDPDLEIVATTPEEVDLAASPAPGTTTTVRFVVDNLAGGTTYRFAPAMDGGTFDPPYHRMKVRTSDVVLTVDLTPAD